MVETTDPVQATMERLKNDLAYAAPEMWLVHVERRMEDLVDALESKPECDLDADDLESISLALGQLPTWFPETKAKIDRMRAALLK